MKQGSSKNIVLLFYSVFMAAMCIPLFFRLFIVGATGCYR